MLTILSIKNLNIHKKKSLKKKKNHKEKCSLKKGFERKVDNFQNTTETTVKHGCNNDG